MIHKMKGSTPTSKEIYQALLEEQKMKLSKEPEPENRLSRENCNKAKCKSCMFGKTPIQLSPERMAEITTYLVNGTSSHICHTTNKTCYGGLELQAKIFHAIGALTEPTVDCLLDTAKSKLSL